MSILHICQECTSKAMPTISEGYLRSQLANLVAVKAIEEISIIPGRPG